jgi:biotin carboxyl carrier protein
MPGTVLDVLVSPGEQVEAGQVLVILEAMKMENEIMAPMAGKVIQVNTTKGAAVNSGDPLLVIG